MAGSVQEWTIISEPKIEIFKLRKAKIEATFLFGKIPIGGRSKGGLVKDHIFPFFCWDLSPTFVLRMVAPAYADDVSRPRAVRAR